MINENVLERILFFLILLKQSGHTMGCVRRAHWVHNPFPQSVQVVTAG